MLRTFGPPLPYNVSLYEACQGASAKPVGMPVGVPVGVPVGSLEEVCKEACT